MLSESRLQRRGYASLCAVDSALREAVRHPSQRSAASQPITEILPPRRIHPCRTVNYCKTMGLTEAPIQFGASALRDQDLMLA